MKEAILARPSSIRGSRRRLLGLWSLTRKWSLTSLVCPRLTSSPNNTKPFTVFTVRPKKPRKSKRQKWQQNPYQLLLRSKITKQVIPKSLKPTKQQNLNKKKRRKRLLKSHKKRKKWTTLRKDESKTSLSRLKSVGSTSSRGLTRCLRNTKPG